MQTHSSVRGCRAVVIEAEALVQAALADLGTFVLSIPEHYGGFAAGGEGDLLAMVVATEEWSRGPLAVAGSLITRPEILGRALLEGATEDQKRTWLPRLWSGEVMSAFAGTEPDYGPTAEQSSPEQRGPPTATTRSRVSRRGAPSPAEPMCCS